MKKWGLSDDTDIAYLAAPTYDPAVSLLRICPPEITAWEHKSIL
jgi:hypothetical protein